MTSKSSLDVPCTCAYVPAVPALQLTLIQEAFAGEHDRPDARLAHFGQTRAEKLARQAPLRIADVIHAAKAAPVVAHAGRADLKVEGSDGLSLQPVGHPAGMKEQLVGIDAKVVHHFRPP